MSARILKKMKVLNSPLWAGFLCQQSSFSLIAIASNQQVKIQLAIFLSLAKHRHVTLMQVWQVVVQQL
jgi:hypothetical protein